MCQQVSGASPMKLFVKRVFGKKKLAITHEVVGETVPNIDLHGSPKFSNMTLFKRICSIKFKVQGITSLKLT